MKYALALLFLLLVACQSAPVCNAPYILVGKECCLDEDANNICDRDEAAPVIPFNDVTKVQITDEQLAENGDKDLPINDVIKRAEEKVKSYTYVSPYDKRDGAIYYVKGDLVRVDLNDVLTLAPGEYVDILLFNRSSEQVTGYCRRWESICRDTTSKEYDLDFDDYWEETPMDVLRYYKNKEAEMVKSDGEVVDDRIVTRFFFKEPAQTTTLWVDAHYGLPVRMLVESPKQSRMYIFDDLAINTIQDEVFTAFNIKPRRGIYS